MSDEKHKASTHLTKKDLKGVDAFQAEGLGLIYWLNSHKKQLGLLLIPIAVIVIGGFGWQQWQTSQTDKRVAELSKTELLYQKEIEAAEKQKEQLRQKITELTKVAAPAAKTPPGSDKKAPPAPALDPAMAAKKAELEKQIADIRAVHTGADGSLSGFEKFSKTYANTPEGWMAGVRAASIYLEEKKLNEAKSYLDKVINETAKIPAYQIQARLMMVGICEDTNDYPGALKQLDVLDTVASDDLKPMLLLTRGRVQMFANSKDDAKKTFATLIEKHANSREAKRAAVLKAMIH